MPRDLAEYFGVHPRTIRRDVQQLTEAGFPIQCEVGSEDYGNGRQYIWIFMSKDWVSSCPGPEIELISDREIIPVEQTSERMTGRRGLLTSKDEIRHFMCTCGHHLILTADGTLDGGKPGCSSCSSWSRHLAHGVTL